MGSRTGFTDNRAQEAQPAPASKGVVRELLETILILSLFILFVRTFVFQQSDIPSASMENTLLIWWSYEEEPGRIYMSLPERLTSWGSKVVHFFTRSRWGRCFSLIR